MSKVYAIITDEIIKRLEQGVIPWRRPWKSCAGGVPDSNIVSGKAYRGINPFLLGTHGFECPYWLTFRQSKQLGGHVRKGEKGQVIIFFTTFDKDEQNDAGDTVTRSLPCLRFYRVFNADQCEGIDHKRLAELRATVDTLPTFDPISEAQGIIDGMPDRPTIEHGARRSCYQPAGDTVQLPDPSRFDPPEEYYSTAFHELVHSTGHKRRLDRRDADRERWFGSGDYSTEELIAEMGAAMLCGRARIEQATLDNSAAYIANWLQVLRKDTRAVIVAASAAQKAADFILGERPATA